MGRTPHAQAKTSGYPRIGQERAQSVYVGKTGIVHIDIPPKATMIDVQEGLKIGKEPGKNPYIDCTEPTGLHLIAIAAMCLNAAMRF